MSKTDGIIAKAYGITPIEKWEAPSPVHGDWHQWRDHAEALASSLRRIQKMSHKHEVQYWLDDPRSDKDKLAAILNETREALASFR